MVLDNLRERIVTWNVTGYRFIKRQSSTSPKYWVETRGRGARPDAQVIAVRSAEKPVATRQSSKGGTGNSSELSLNENNRAKADSVVTEAYVDGATEISHEQPRDLDALERDTSL
jgi:hypothetical protein